MTLSKQYGKYIVTLTKHSLKRILERNIPGNRIIHTILTAAEQNKVGNTVKQEQQERERLTA